MRVYGSVQVRLVGWGCDAEADYGDHREQHVLHPCILGSNRELQAGKFKKDLEAKMVSGRLSWAFSELLLGRKEENMLG